MATTSRRKSDSATGSNERTPRRVKKADAAPASRDVAAEAAAIYPDTFDTPPTPDEIAAEAYNIYRERGGDHGRDAEDWYEAERRISARRAAERQNQS